MRSEYLNAIRNFEGFTPRAVQDYAQLTNGYGTRARFPGEVIDRGEAEHRFREELAHARRTVERHAAHADEGTKAALTSLTFNAGDKWTRSGLGEAIRSGDLETARGLLREYTRAGGQVLPGLVRRRAAEASWMGQQASGAPSGQQPTIADSPAVLAVAAAQTTGSSAPPAEPREASTAGSCRPSQARPLLPLANSQTREGPHIPPRAASAEPELVGTGPSAASASMDARALQSLRLQLLLSALARDEAPLGQGTRENTARL